MTHGAWRRTASVERGLGLPHDVLLSPLQPRGLRARGGDRSEALQLAGRLGQCERLVERGPHVGIAAPGAHQGEHREGEDARHRPRATVAQRLGGGVGRLRPQPAVELQAGAAGDEEQPPQVHAALGAVLEAGVEVAIDDVIAAHAQRPPHEVEVGAAGVLLQPGAQGELQAALELRRRLRGAGEDLDRADVGERVGEHLGVVELLAERERLGVPGGGLLRVLRRRVEVTEVGVGERQLAPAGQSLEAGHRLEADLGGLLGAPQEAVQPRERAQAVALRERVRARAAQRQGRSCAAIAASSSPMRYPS